MRAFLTWLRDVPRDFEWELRLERLWQRGNKGEGYRILARKRVFRGSSLEEGQQMSGTLLGAEVPIEWCFGGEERAECGREVFYVNHRGVFFRFVFRGKLLFTPVGEFWVSYDFPVTKVKKLREGKRASFVLAPRAVLKLFFFYLSGKISVRWVNLLSVEESLGLVISAPSVDFEGWLRRRTILYPQPGSERGRLVAGFLETPKPLAFSPRFLWKEERFSPTDVEIVEEIVRSGEKFFGVTGSGTLVEMGVEGAEVVLFGEGEECDVVFKQQLMGGFCPSGYIRGC